jgi:aminoglycoside phosphotransferase (APT) family kinase protein
VHRREARITSVLPADLPVPALLDVIVDGHWVVLVFEEVEGECPALPWATDDLAATFAALQRLAADATPCPVPGLPTVAERFAGSFNGYRLLAAGDPSVDQADPWSRAHLDQLADLESGWEAAAAGDSLLHTDLRADNLLVRPDGTVVVVDWPHACVGAPWVDLAFMLPAVGLDGGPTPAAVEAELGPLAGADPEAVDRVVVGLAGYFTFHGLQPDPPGLPTLRAFQRAQAQVTRDWLSVRLGLD